MVAISLKRPSARPAVLHGRLERRCQHAAGTPASLPAHGAGRDPRYLTVAPGRTGYANPSRESSLPHHAGDENHAGPITNPAMEPKSSQPAKPRLRSGEYSATNRRWHIHRQPRSLAPFTQQQQIGAQIPIVAYDGIRPIQKVLIDMITIVIARILPL